MTQAMVVHEGNEGNGPMTDLVVHRPPEAVLAEAQRAAQALMKVVEGKKKPVRFNGETYLECEDWQTVGRFYGLTARVVRTAPVAIGDVTGWEAFAEIIRVADGEVVSTGESMCTNDEKNWKDRPTFMLRSMAQTRAVGKAFRNCLSWVVVLAGFKPTPAEEMDGVFPTAPPPPRQTAKPAPVVEATVVPPGDPSHAPGAVGSDVPDMEIWFGRDKGNRVSTLNWNALKNLNDWATKTWEKPTGRQSELLACVAYHLAEKAAQSNLKPTPADADGEEIPF